MLHSNWVKFLQNCYKGVTNSVKTSQTKSWKYLTNCHYVCFLGENSHLLRRKVAVKSEFHAYKVGFLSPKIAKYKALTIRCILQMSYQSINYEICLHLWYVTLWECNIVTLLHCYIVWFIFWVSVSLCSINGMKRTDPGGAATVLYPFLTHFVKKANKRFISFYV